MTGRRRWLRPVLAGWLLAGLWLAGDSAEHRGIAAPAPPSTASSTSDIEIATFAGGCFWCVESDFDKIAGVTATISGFTGGHVKNPTYKEVSAGGTGHAEAVEIHFDPARVSYARLLDVFWHSIDPTVKDQQFCDVGNQYRTAIFYHTDEQKRLAEESKAALERSKPFKEPIVTEITAAAAFYPAEEYHQNFYKKESVRYHFYRYNCGRDQRLEQLWGSK
ncbi:MAG: peptide-methionine (S)-S-oxide reductase MsrA [Nitrospirae bacterium]|nr:peptide-methionine (S)-S-oxide reductase MsrA [Nitrospirota bacterium]